MAEWISEKPIVLHVTDSDIPADYGRNDRRSLWLCECGRLNYEFEIKCIRCDEDRFAHPPEEASDAVTG